MDPYLEGQVWEDFPDELVMEIKARLVPQIRPRYVARLRERVYLERHSEDMPPFAIPDVALFEERPAPVRRGAAVAIGEQAATVPLPMPEPVREIYLELRLHESREVVAVVEVLSPGNKRLGSTGRKEYLAKRDAVLQSSAHLVEIDLLRGGERLPMARALPPGDYYAILSQAQRRPLADVWASTLRERLPTIPIPLAGEDPDAALDLQAALQSVYDRSGYDYSIDYEHGTVPPLNAVDEAWAASLLHPSA